MFLEVWVVLRICLGVTLLAREAGRPRVSTGCAAVDAALRGGLRRGSITEIYGESGSGKTQICLQALTACWQKGAVYVCTEDAFPSRRLQQILENAPGYDPGTDYGGNIFILHITEAEELLHCARVRLPAQLARRPAALLVLDSVAAPFRTAYSDYTVRARHMRALGVALLRAARDYNAAVLCVNQVSADLSPEGGALQPALGLSWSNMVTTRLALTRELGAGAGARLLRARHAPDLPAARELRLVITARGVEAAEGVATVPLLPPH